MKLRDYLDREGLSYSAFGRRIGVSSQAIRRYAEAGRVPAPAVMQAIIEATDADVRPDDFFDVPARPAEKGCAA